jgi:hypothetical protein
MRIPRHCLLIPLLAAAVAVATASDVSAGDIEVTAQTLEAVQNGSFVDVKFRIGVTNAESSVISNAWVVFADGVHVYIGDVEAGKSVLSAQETRTFDVSEFPTRYLPVSVTLKFASNGENVELTRTIVVRLYVPPAEEQ